MLAQLDLRPRKLIVPGVIVLAFWTLAVTLWQVADHPTFLFLFGYIGTSLGIGLGLYATLPKKKKPIGRRISLLLIGSFLFGFLGIYARENIQIEWFFFSILAGLSGAALMHYMIAKLFIPLLFGRLWCGWACWTVMILDLLPFKQPSGRLPRQYGWLRYLHFFLSLALVTVLWFGFNYREGIDYGTLTGLYWMLAGNALYYAVGIGLAFALKDNRAFCKYVCPITVILKLTSRFSLLKVKGDAERCEDCWACVKMCPMDIRIPDYIKAGKRVLSTECSLCQTCITTCSNDALKLSFGFDVGGLEYLRERSE